MNQRILRKSSDVVEVFAPAKINLFLAVTGKRSDGYHDLCTVMVKTSVGDRLSIKRVEGCRQVELSCPHFGELETTENLVCVAVRKWMHRSAQDFGVEIFLEKELPPMSGLGGGSSDAASALIAMNKLTDEKLPLDALVTMAGEIGSDCSAFLTSGPCVAEGRGEIVRPLEGSRSKNLLGRKVLLFRPDLGLSTMEVYREFSENFSPSPKEWSTERLKLWQEGDLSNDEFLHNDLEEPVFKKHRYFKPLFEKIKQLFGLAPRMSGSGSCCFALIPDDFDSISNMEDEIYRAWGKTAWIKVCEIID